MKSKRRMFFEFLAENRFLIAILIAFPLSKGFIAYDKHQREIREAKQLEWEKRANCEIVMVENGTAKHSSGTTLRNMPPGMLKICLEDNREK